MSSKQHRKQVARAKQKRQRSKFERRTARNRTIILVMAILMGLSLIAVPLGLAIGRGDTTPAPEVEDAADEPGEPEEAAGPGPCGETPDEVPEIDSSVYDEPFDLTIDEDATYVATLETTCGDVVIELDVEGAPLAVNNLVNLAEDGYYDGLHFHRVVAGFVIQFGDPAGTGCGQEDCSPEGFDPDAPTFPGYTFEDELDTAEQLYEQVREEQREELLASEELEDAEDELDEELLELLPGGYPRGTVAMANAGPDSNGSQFFVAQEDPTLLPGPQFTVLGTVIEGMDVVDDIAASPVDEQDRPFEPVVVRRVTIDS